MNRTAAIRITLYLGGLALTAVAFFGLGSYSAHQGTARQIAESDARIDALRADITRSLQSIGRQSQLMSGSTSGLDGTGTAGVLAGNGGGQATIVEEIKKQLQAEMGLLPVRVLRDRRASFVELYAYDSFGKANYGTAGYLGGGYFITVKHGVVALAGDDDREREPRHIVSIKVLYRGRMLPARLVDAGDADVEVHRGDWAIIKVREAIDLPALKVDTGFAYEFAEPIFRLGNDYSKGIILATGNVGQRTSNGLVTCLTDGHPGVSGGGVLDRRGNLVGIPIGRMQGDFRFSFILPLRQEMFRKVPAIQRAESSVS